MAKVSYSKLKLQSILPVKELKWEDQKIEVKQYISIQDKLKMVTEILGLSADDNKFYNVGKIKVFKVLKIIDYYTNISITEKQKEHPVKLYDEVIASNFFNKIYSLIPEEETEELNYILYDTVEQIYKYQNSAYGIMDSLSTDYNNLDLDIQKLTQKLENKEGVEFLNEVLTKMG